VLTISDASPGTCVTLQLALQRSASSIAGTSETAPMATLQSTLPVGPS